MIQANELRIGNYLIDRTFGNTAPTYVDAEWLVKISEGEFDADPIPLAPEILEKAGFILRGFYYHFPNHDIFKLEQYKLKNSYWLRHSTQSIDSVRINYLHQLQNLYFALTGEELEINL